MFQCLLVSIVLSCSVFVRGGCYRNDSTSQPPVTLATTKNFKLVQSSAPTYDNSDMMTHENLEVHQSFTGNVSDFEIDNISKENQVEYTTLFWSSLLASIKNKVIINIPPGKAQSGRLLGVLGPSGSGKTTFVKIISARQQPSKGQVVVSHTNNGMQEDEQLTKSDVAFVHQDDSFFPMLTVRETLTLAAELRQHSHHSNRSGDHTLLRPRVNELMFSLDLDKVADTMVGSRSGDSGGVSGSHHGISGGERKRLAVACELLGDPLLLVADEPTSGLDSFQAHHIVSLLRDLARTKNIVTVCTIHQPRSSTWNLLDDVMLLTPLGKVAYHGPRDNVVSYFAALGHVCPDRTNPAEFLIDLVSVDTSSVPSLAESVARSEQLAHFFMQQQQEVTVRTTTNTIGNTAIAAQSPSSHMPRSESMLSRRLNLSIVKTKLRSVVMAVQRSGQRFLLLLQRASKQTLRDWGTNIARMAVSTMLALVIGNVYGQQCTGTDASIDTGSVSSRVNIIAQAVINVAMLSMIKTLQLFQRERRIVDRERAQSQFTSGEYLLSKACAELPLDALVAAVFGLVLHGNTHMRCDRFRFVSLLSLLGATTSALGLAVGTLCPSGDVALAVGPALMVVFLILGSIGPAGVGGGAGSHWALRPFTYGSPMRWGCEALCAAEFRGVSFAKPAAGHSIAGCVGQLSNGLRSLPIMAAVLRNVAHNKFNAVMSKAIPSQSIRFSQQQPNTMTSPQSDGDHTLTALGIPDAQYAASSRVLWHMLCGHLVMALMGLIVHQPRS